MLLNCGVGGDSWESLLDFKEIKPVKPKRNQSWIFIGRTDAEVEMPILWPFNVKNWLIGKDPDAGKDWRQMEKGATEDEMVGWHHRLNGYEFEQALGVGDGQGGGVQQSMGSRRVRHDWLTKLNWLTAFRNKVWKKSKQPVIALPILDQLSAWHICGLTILTVCPGPAPSVCPPTVPREAAVSGRMQSAARMGVGFSWVPSMLQTTLGFHGQLNGSRKQHVVAWGLKEFRHMDSISSVARVCLNIEEEMPGIDGFQVSEISSNQTCLSVMALCFYLGSTLGFWLPQKGLFSMMPGLTHSKQDASQN